MMIWCRIDEMYVCRRCWEDLCNEGHGQGRLNEGRHPLESFLFMIAMLSMIIPLACVGLTDVIIRNQWSKIEVSPISEIEEGDVVRLEGIIDEDRDVVAISGHESRVKSGYTWKWNDDDYFKLSDGTGTIIVSTRRYYDMEEGLHPAPNRAQTNGKVYIGGDEVIIIGYMEVIGDETYLFLRWIGTDEDDIKPSTISYFGTICIWSLIIIPIALLIHLSIVRRRFHSKKVCNVNPKTISKKVVKKDPILDWKKNSGIPRNVVLIINTSITLTGILILPIAYITFEAHTFNDYIGFALVSMFVLPFMVFFPFLYLISRDWMKPNDIATSDLGIHFNYPDPVIRFLKDDFIGWGEIKKIGYHSAGKSGYWSIDKKNNTSENINSINRANRDYIISQWKMRPENKDRYKKSPILKKLLSENNSG